jgi:hypothetical protein
MPQTIQCKKENSNPYRSMDIDFLTVQEEWVVHPAREQ